METSSLVKNIVEIFNSKIIVFNTMNIPYSEVEFGRLIHLGGTNGYGKTSFLRIGAYPFAGPKNLGLEKDQESFRKFYFETERDNSGERPYIVYEFTRTNQVPDGTKSSSKFIVVMYLPSANDRLHYFFADTPYDPSYFFDNENRVKDRWQDVVTSIKEALENNTSRYVRVTSYESLRRILFGCYTTEKSERDINIKISSGELKKFALFRFRPDVKNTEVAMNQICKAICNIMLPVNKAEITTMNSILESVLPDLNNRSFRYAEYKQTLDDFSNRLSSFRIIESEKYKRHFQNILSVYPKYGETIKKTKSFLSELKYSYERAKSELNAAEEQLSLLHENLSKKTREKSEWDGQYHKTDKDLNAKSILLEQEIQKLEKTYSSYLEYIQKADSYKILPEKKSERGNLISQVKTLSAEIEKLTTVHEEQVANIKQLFENYKLKEYDIKVNQCKVQLQADYNKVDKETLQKITELRSAVEEERLALMSDKQRLENQIEEVKRKLQKVFEEYLPKKSEINTQEALILRAEQDIKLKETLLKSLEEKQISENEKLENLSQTASMLFDERIQNAQKKVQDIKNKIISVEKKLENFDASFAGWLTDNMPGWENNVGQIVRNELLESHSLHPDKTNDENESIFGIRITLEDAHFPVSNRQAIEQEFTTLNEELEKARKEEKDITEEKDNWLNDNKKAIEKKLAELNEEIKSESRQKTNAEAIMKTAEAAKSALLEEQKAMQTKLFEHLKKNKTELEETLSARKKEIDNFNATLKTKEDKCNLEAELKKETLTKKSEEELNRLKESLQKMERQRDKSLQDEQAAYNERLSAKADTSKKVAELSTRISELDAFINPLEAGNGWNIWELKVLPFLTNEYVTYEPTKQELEKTKEEIRKLETENQEFYIKWKKETDRINNDIQAKENVIAVYRENIIFMEGGVDKNGNPVVAFLDSIAEEYRDCPMMENNRSCRDIIESYRNEDDKLKRILQSLTNSVDTILNGLSAPQKRFLFEEQKQFAEHTSIEEIKWMYDYLRHNKIEMLRKLANMDIGVFITRMIEVGKSWNAYVKDARKLINAINDEFEKVNFIPTVRKILVKIDVRHDNYSTFFERIRERFDGTKDILSIDFFSKQNSGIINFILDASKEAESNPAGEIKAIDSVLCTFRVDENRKIGKWTTTFESTGSNGIRIFVKNMFFAVVLRRLIEKYLSTNNKYYFPIWIDEIGTLTPGYLQKFILGVLDYGFNVITLAPLPNRDIDPTLFKAHYLFIRNEDTLTTYIQPIAIEKKDVKGIYFEENVATTE